VDAGCGIAPLTAETVAKNRAREYRQTVKVRATLNWTPQWCRHKILAKSPSDVWASLPVSP
jgi:hypothetical protein